MAGLALIAVTAGAGTASAQEWASFKSSQASPALTGSSSTTITIQGSTLECVSSLSGVGSPTKTSNSMWLTPSVSCNKPFGWIPVTVESQGCEFGFSALFRTVSVRNCTSGAMVMKWHAPYLLECVVEVPNQGFKNSATTYTNVPNNAYLELGMNHSFTANVTVSKQACPLKVENPAQLFFTADYDIYANQGQSEFWWQMNI